MPTTQVGRGCTLLAVYPKTQLALLTQRGASGGIYFSAPPSRRARPTFLPGRRHGAAVPAARRALLREPGLDGGLLQQDGGHPGGSEHAGRGRRQRPRLRPLLLWWRAGVRPWLAAPCVGRQQADRQEWVRRQLLAPSCRQAQVLSGKPSVLEPVRAHACLPAV